MIADKAREERLEAITSRLDQIDAALRDFWATIHHLRQERLNLWHEYYTLLTTDLKVSNEPRANTGIVD